MSEFAKAALFYLFFIALFALFVGSISFAAGIDEGKRRERATIASSRNTRLFCSSINRETYATTKWPPQITSASATIAEGTPMEMISLGARIHMLDPSWHCITLIDSTGGLQ